jgi:hypothetical protein
MTNTKPPDTPALPAEPALPEMEPAAPPPDLLAQQSLISRVGLLFQRESSDLRISLLPGDGPHLPHTSKECWCQPETFHVDPETGATIIVHRRIQ